MRQKAVSVVLLILVLAGMLTLAFDTRLARSEPRTWTVDDDGPADFNTIQEAINAASDGDVIQVSAGTYRQNLYIDKSLTVIGENKENTTLDGKGGYSTVEVNSTTVIVSGFTIINGTRGIWLERCSGSLIKRNYVSCPIGIWLHYSDNNTVSENTVSNCRSYGILLCGGSSGNVLTRNAVRENGNGLGITGQYNVIYNNSFLNNKNQTLIIESFHNAWNRTGEGNYWSDHNPPDEDLDKIGDISYFIDENNLDRSPLIYPYGFAPKPDVDANGIVNIADIARAAAAFASRPGDERWDPIVDMDINERINITDVARIATQYGKQTAHG